MDIYKTLIEKSTDDELAELIKNMAAEIEKYRTAFYAAKKFIDCHAADPGLTPEMAEAYDLYNVAIRGTLTLA
jgi:transcription initiation factor IIE alpha subunit